MTPTRNRIFRPVLALAMALGLSACASVDTTSRDAPLPSALQAPTQPQAAPAVAASSFKVVQVAVNVPQSLRVSEANRYYPSGDIVWREDPIGDRHAQVKAIVEAGLSKGASRLDGDREVILKVSVTRFHALTEKARYTIGGVHAIQFYMTVVDAETGETLIPSHFVKADFDALGGAAAVASEARGVTQKVRITDHLAVVIQDELLKPTGYLAQNTGVIGAINQL
jgi:hypothetical protein